MDVIKELKRDGMLLKKIPKKEQTTDICKIAIKQNPLALRFASRKCLNTKLCLAAVKKDGRAFQYVPDPLVTKRMCESAVEADPKLLKNVPENFKTPIICINAVKKDVTALSYIPSEKRCELFDNNTEINLIEKIISYDPKWLIYMPNRPDVRALCIKYMAEDFSIAQYIPEQIKISEDILNYQKSEKKLQFEQKCYDSEGKRFKVKIKVIYGQYISTFDENNVIEKSYCIIKEFEDFAKFYDFLDGNLFDAELGDYDFYGIDLKKYNIKGAVINSEILQSQGLYDESYFSAIKKLLETNVDEFLENNEIVRPNKFCYLKPIDDGVYEQYDGAHIPFFYISDIHLAHQICNKFKNRATKEEIRSYIKFLVRSMVSSIGTRPHNSYLLIAGDTSSLFEFSAIFYNELIQYWNSSNIIIVSGNHELLNPWVDMETNIEIYRKFFNDLGIAFLQNDLLYIEHGQKYKIICEAEILKMSEEDIRKQTQYSSIIVLGGIGFSGLNKEFNASNTRYGKSFDELPREAALLKDIQEANRFNIIYTKIFSSLNKSKVIVLTHVKKDDWNMEEYNPHWIYLNGHNHRNFYEISNRKTIYADNQIGYQAKNFGLKYFYCDNAYDIFAYYQNGIHQITREQYIDFNRGKQVSISFKKEDGTIYMLKRNNVYLFLIYSFKSLYILEGGKLNTLERHRLEDLSYYYDNLEKYAKNVNQLLRKYTDAQQKLSEFIKRLGGSGKIHGCIVDVEKPSEFRGFSYCHLFVNPIDGKVTPYFAYDVKARIIYKDFKTLLQSHNSCKSLASNYLLIEKEASQNLPVVQCWAEWENRDEIYDEGSYLYKISRIIKSLQYCVEKNIIRLWKEELISHDFTEQIEQVSQIGEIPDDKLITD